MYPARKCKVEKVIDKVEGNRAKGSTLVGRVEPGSWSPLYL